MALMAPPTGIVMCHSDVSESITQRESIHAINKAKIGPKKMHATAGPFELVIDVSSSVCVKLGNKSGRIG